MIRKLLKKCIVWIMRDNDEIEQDELRTVSSSKRRGRVIAGTHSELESSGMVFHLYAAEGGTVIETSFYDRKNDCTDHRLYIIPDGEDFTSTLGQIVSMERIKSWH